MNEAQQEKIENIICIFADTELWEYLREELLSDDTSPIYKKMCELYRCIIPETE
jgi:hypothetical protein